MQFIEDVCKVKNGLQPIKYLTPELEPILKKTYGAIVYQEQVMEICQSLAGYTLGQADMVRRYMSKKKTEKLNYERNDFVYGNPERNITGCVANGIDENAANALFDQMTDFAKYAFNKSHAVAYSVVAYQTAWLKYHYTAEYMCTLLNYTDKVEKYLPIINNAKEMGIEVLPPDINKSEEKFSIYDGKILFGLSSVKSVGKAAEKIIQVRRDTGMFASFKDYMLRGHVKNNVDVALIESGAFDGGEYTRSSLLSVAYTDLKDYVAEKNKKEKFIQSAEKVIEIIGKENITDVNILKEAIKEQGFSYQITSKKIPTIDSIKNRIANAKTAIDDFVSQINELKFPRIRENKDLNLSNEKKNLGVYLTGHPIDKYRVVTAPIELVADDTLAITGIISDLTIRYDRSKKEWATFTLEDQSGTISVACFSKDYAKLGFELKEGMCIYAAGKAEVDDFKSTEEETVYRFTASELKQAQEKKDPYILYLPSEADYFFDKADMIRNCKDANGVELVIFFQSTGIHRKLKYLVSETEIAKIGAVKDQ